ncbi:MAG: hypothetical protein ACYC26_16755 [Phycisphaerales bacterium]
MGLATFIIIVLQIVIPIYWVMQIIAVIVAPDRFFESHTHRLAWFLVVVFVPLIGAIWFSIWHWGKVQAAQQALEDQRVHVMADFLKSSPPTT